MKNTIFHSSNDWRGLILRLTLGLIIFPHGAQKALGWSGGYGFSGTMGFFIDTMNLPWLIAFMVIVIEFVGSISLIAGFASRIWSAWHITHARRSFEIIVKFERGTPYMRDVSAHLKNDTE